MGADDGTSGLLPESGENGAARPSTQKGTHRIDGETDRAPSAEVDAIDGVHGLVLAKGDAAEQPDRRDPFLKERQVVMADRARCPQTQGTSGD